MAVVHNHSPAVLPFCIARGARLRPVCHMAGFLGGATQRDGPALFEIRDHAGDGERPVDPQPRARRRAGAHARRFARGADARPRLHRRRRARCAVAVFRAVYTEVNAKLLLQALPLGEVDALTPERGRCHPHHQRGPGRAAVGLVARAGTARATGAWPGRVAAPMGARARPCTIAQSTIAQSEGRPPCTDMLSSSHAAPGLPRRRCWRFARQRPARWRRPGRASRCASSSTFRPAAPPT